MLNGSILIFLILAILVIILVMKGFIIVKQSETMVIERLGKYERTLSSGINIIWPIFEQARPIYMRYSINTLDGRVMVKFTQRKKIDMREQVFDFPKQNVITKDNVTTTINALLYYQIVDPYKAVYEIENLPLAIEKLAQTTLRNVIGELELDETLTSRDTINSKLRNVLDDATNKWGVKVNRVELQDITPPDSVRYSMEQQMQAERERRAQVTKANGDKEAAVLTSEGQKIAAINKAEAEKQKKILEAQGIAEAKILQAQAEAEAIEKVAQAIQGANMTPAQYLLADKYIATLKDIASGQGNKTVYLPYEATTALSSIGALKDIFDKKD
ncbi:MAG: paraslipin [Bacteroidaceae bacterium]|nr:paraslipin [Bacteroidaceae bacterium]